MMYRMLYKKSKVSTPEKVILVFSNWLLILCVLSAFEWWDYWWYKAALEYGQTTRAGLAGSVLLLWCIMPFTCWIISLIWALIKTKSDARQRIWALALAPIVVVGLFPIWAALIFAVEWGIALALSFISVAIIISDVLFAKTLKSATTMPMKHGGRDR